MVGIFRTNIATRQDKNRVLDAIRSNFTVTACSVDLEDCDKVLRIVTQHSQLEESVIISFVQRMGYQCDILE